ncbi:MAG: indolepyruvate ferredoxin oxidoreductase family protein [Rhodobacteraceae bacterium]|nr:indolepyruvate ferredoxin oxidoreductase family protein [Paracoccaceae bacterium]
MLRQVKLTDRFDLSCPQVLLNGTQALVRLMLVQRARDRAAGLDTAGYVTGYRGSPLGAVDLQMQSAGQFLADANILFQPAINEDLAITALWGAQQAELRGEGKHDGVFGLWYGKGPGVDRSGDALRHANLAGCSPNGGVVMALGDDHTAESSTTVHQSEWTLIDCYVPILAPAGVQEIIDYGLVGYEMGRFSGNWVGLKCVKEVVESTAVIDGRIDRIQLRRPDFAMPPDGLNIRLQDSPLQSEARIIDYRASAAEVFARANSLDKRMHGRSGAQIGIVGAGKNWLDVVHALELLGLDRDELVRLGISTYKIAMTWPLDRRSLQEWSQGLKLIIVVEEKRKLIEQQVRDTLFDLRREIRVFGHRDGDGNVLFTTRYELNPVAIALGIGGVLEREDRLTSRLQDQLRNLEALQRRDNSGDILHRKAYFCSGCPHSTSTKIPDDSRAYAGIGCHYMVQWMDRNTLGFTQMGGEGANWIGEAPFSKREHVFQNIGDGTYNHSGLMAIRAALHAGVNITFKILFNDAVAMTGGQKNDGDLTPYRILREVQAMGVEDVVLVYDAKEGLDFGKVPSGVRRFERAEINRVQLELRERQGVSVLLYVQTCAAEKRRRRRRGTFAPISERVFINQDVCEGCGDCGRQSNCVSIIPVDTEFGRKRAIDQSSCNMDLRCLDGFCPSFVSVKGGKPKPATTSPIEIPQIPEPDLPEIAATHNIVITGIGGTGVVTIGAVLAMAAHLDNLGVGMIEMAGLAQKGGAVTVHCRIARQPDDISAVRVAAGEADCLIGGDIVTSAVAATLDTVSPGGTVSVINSEQTITGDFTRDIEATIPVERLRQRFEAAAGGDKSRFVNASKLAKTVLGDSIYSNALLMGAVWQMGGLPLSGHALRKAIELNGVKAEQNLKAFEIGRWIAADSEIESKLGKRVFTRRPEPVALNPIEYRYHHLVQYQDKRLADRYAEFVKRFDDSRLQLAVARSYYKVLAIKDEFEVARLHLSTKNQVAREFTGNYRLEYHLAPPILNRTNTEGRIGKRRFGGHFHRVFQILAACRRIRGTALDPFRYSGERKLQNRHIAQFEQDMERVLKSGVGEWSDAAMQLAELPMSVRGFGVVWLENYRAADARRGELLRELDADIAADQTGQRVQSIAA